MKVLVGAALHPLSDQLQQLPGEAPGPAEVAGGDVADFVEEEHQLLVAADLAAVEDPPDSSQAASSVKLTMMLLNTPTHTHITHLGRRFRRRWWRRGRRLPQLPQLPVGTHGVGEDQQLLVSDV